MLLYNLWINPEPFNISYINGEEDIKFPGGFFLLLHKIRIC